MIRCRKVHDANFAAGRPGLAGRGTICRIFPAITARAHRAPFSKLTLLLSRWLNDPQFVGSFETEDHVYFLFRESAVEYINCGKVRPTPIR